MGNTSTASAAVVLVHGGFVDGSGWEDVYRILKKDGYQVSIVQNPTSSLADDVAATQRVVAGQKAPVVLVGHSYGGVVITEAGNDPNVAALVYIAAFAPDKGESVAALIKDPPPGAPVPPILPPQRRLSIARYVEVRRFLRRRPAQGKGRVHGQLAASLGRRGSHRRDQRARLEGEAELVPGRHRRPDDPARRAACDVETRGRDGDRIAQAATRSMCRSRKRSPESSGRPLNGWRPRSVRSARRSNIA